MAGAADITVLVEIEGVVQGVAYRDWTQRMAKELGLKGWVRNRRNGHVEALFHGPDTAVGEMVEKCWQGPPAARVSVVRSTRIEVPAPSGGFEIQPTL